MGPYSSALVHATLLSDRLHKLPACQQQDMQTNSLTELLRIVSLLWAILCSLFTSCKWRDCLVLAYCLTRAVGAQAKGLTTMWFESLSQAQDKQSCSKWVAIFAKLCIEAHSYSAQHPQVMDLAGRWDLHESHNRQNGIVRS